MGHRQCQLTPPSPPGSLIVPRGGDARTDTRPVPGSDRSIPKRWRLSPPDGRSRGTMAQSVREFLTDNPQGWSRLELKAALTRDERFATQFQRNPGAYYNMIGRLLHRGDLEDRNGLLFASDKTRRRVVESRQARDN